MAKPKSFDTNEGISKLALELGVCVSTVSRKRKQGKTDEQIRTEAAEWKAKQTKLDHQEQQGDESYSEAIKRKEIALADLRELELATKRGELAPVAEINAFVSSMIIRARDILSRIAPELRDRLAKETDPIRIHQLIEAEVVRALIQLSQFKGGVQ